MFVSKAQACNSEAPVRSSTLKVGYSLTRKHYRRLERLARDKRSSLVLPIGSYDEKSFVNTAQCSKTLKGYILFDSVIS